MFFQCSGGKYIIVNASRFPPRPIADCRRRGFKAAQARTRADWGSGQSMYFKVASWPDVPSLYYIMCTGVRRPLRKNCQLFSLQIWQQQSGRQAKCTDYSRILAICTHRLHATTNRCAKFSGSWRNIWMYAAMDYLKGQSWREHWQMYKKRQAVVLRKLTA